MRIVILTGAGISAESGLGTFRDVGGLWARYDMAEVATPEGFARDPGKVHDFYNARRANAAGSVPNAAHLALGRLVSARPGEVVLVTQNIDDLHERGGAAGVIHMHGELFRALCAACGARWDAPAAMHPGDACPVCGARATRPDVVWFGEIPYHLDRIFDALAKAGDSGRGNLLALAVDAARAKATVGEISGALERVWGRHTAEIKAISGVYRREGQAMSDQITRIQELVEQFVEDEGRRPRILVAKVGQDGHDRGQKVIASAFADLGFDVDIGPLFATPEEAARQAIENDVHIVGVSSLAAGHLTLVPALRDALAAEGRPDIMIVAGGVIPPQDYDALKAAGASAIFPPGTVIAQAAESLIHELNQRLGHSREAAE